MVGWHLEYTIDVDRENRVVYEKIFGIWKEHTAKSYHADFQEEVADILDGPWVKLIDLSNWKAGYPEVVDIIGRHLTWCRKHNMEWSVNIISNPSTFRTLNQMFAKGGTKGISKTFRTREEAEKFLTKKGYKLRERRGSGGGAPF